MGKRVIIFLIIVILFTIILIGLNHGFTPVKACSECPKVQIKECPQGEGLFSDEYRVEGYCFNTCSRAVCRAD